MEQFTAHKHSYECEFPIARNFYTNDEVHDIMQDAYWCEAMMHDLAQMLVYNPYWRSWSGGTIFDVKNVNMVLELADYYLDMILHSVEEMYLVLNNYSLMGEYKSKKTKDMGDPPIKFTDKISLDRDGFLYDGKRVKSTKDLVFIPLHPSNCENGSSILYDLRKGIIELANEVMTVIQRNPITDRTEIVHRKEFGDFYEQYSPIIEEVQKAFMDKVNAVLFDQIGLRSEVINDKGERLYRRGEYLDFTQFEINPKDITVA